MFKSLILRYEQKIKNFEEKLNKTIFSFLKNKKICTTSEINNYLKEKDKNYKAFYKESPARALYRIKKILQNLEKKSVLKKSLSIGKVGKFQFLNYRWELIKK